MSYLKHLKAFMVHIDQISIVLIIILILTHIDYKKMNIYE